MFDCMQITEHVTTTGKKTVIKHEAVWEHEDDIRELVMLKIKHHILPDGACPNYQTQGIKQASSRIAWRDVFIKVLLGLFHWNSFVQRFPRTH